MRISGGPCGEGNEDDRGLTARIEPFDSFWEAPEDVQKGFRTFGAFYASNYLPCFPSDKGARILVISCGPGYLVQLLADRGYEKVIGIDSYPEKIAHGLKRGLHLVPTRLYEFFESNDEPFDVIFAEQEINHLTKPEILFFLRSCLRHLEPDGLLVVHSINGANPFTGSESRAGNFDHYNSFTEYSLAQVLCHAGFEEVRVLPLNLYVFPKNPLNWIARLAATLNRMFFLFQYRLVGKSASIFTKKIAASARKPSG